MASWFHPAETDDDRQQWTYFSAGVLFTLAVAAAVQMLHAFTWSALGLAIMVSTLAAVIVKTQNAWVTLFPTAVTVVLFQALWTQGFLALAAVTAVVLWGFLHALASQSWKLGYAV